MRFYTKVTVKIAGLIYSKLELIGNLIKEERHNRFIKGFAKLGTNSTFVYKDYRIIGEKYIIIGDHFSVGRSFRLEAFNGFRSDKESPQLVIGNNVRIEDYCHIACVNKVEIGNNVLIASKVFITDHFHGNIDSRDIDIPPSKRPLVNKPVIIGDNVWIGDNVSVLPGVVLGDNVIIGANAVVTHSFPHNSVIAGCPARLLKTL